MNIALFEITARTKDHATALSGIGDFGLTPAGQISEAVVLASPDWTLYCLDVNSRRAVFVELPIGTDLSRVPFVYAQQYTEACRAALMPFDRLIAMSDAIAPPTGLAFLFSTGRCGSTLASRILAQLPEVWNLS